MRDDIRLPISRCRLRLAALLLATAMPWPLSAQAAPPATTQLPTGGQVVAGQASISQSGANMNINQGSSRAAINWQSFDIGSGAQVNFIQPSSSSVALNRILGGNPTQIFGQINANGQVFVTNAAGIYFAPGSSANVGGLVATTHSISDSDFMAGNYNFSRDGAQGSVVNQGTLTANLGGYIALLAPEVRNEGVIVAQMGTVALVAGETYTLQFNGQGGLADVTVTPATIAALVENKQAVEAPGGLIIMSAQAANHLQGGVVKNGGTLEATGLTDDGGVIRLTASDDIQLGGTANADAAPGSSGNGGKITAVAGLDNPDSTIEVSGALSARGGSAGGDGGSVETSGSTLTLANTATVDTSAPAGKTGTWLLDPYDYTIDGSAATVIDAALNTANVTVSTAMDDASYGSNGNSASTGNITVNSAISSASDNTLTLTAANAIDVEAAISTGALTLTGPGGITLDSNLSTITGMTLNGNVALSTDVTLTSGVSNTYTAYTVYTVPTGVTSLTATLTGASGGKGGTDTSTGGDGGDVGVLTASFDVTGGESIYIAPGSAGLHGGNQVTNTGGSAGGTNQFNLGNGGAGGNAGPSGNSGGGAGGGAATVLALSGTPTSSSQLLVAGGGGGGGGAGNNTACPSLCGDQVGANYVSGAMTGQTGYNSGNQASPVDDGGGSGGGGGGIEGGAANLSIFFVNEWTGRGGNVGQSGAANGFTTTSLSTSITNIGNSANGSAIISYGGGTVAINGTVDGAHALNIVARSSNVDITGAVGGSAALSSLNIIGSQGIALEGGSVRTTGAQTYTGPVTLNTNNTMFTSTGNGNIAFAGNIVKGTGFTSNMTVSNGSGNVSLNGQTGSSGTPVGAVNVASTGATTIGGALYASTLTVTGAGTTTISGGLVQTSGGQSYGGALNLGSSATLNSTGTGDIDVAGIISNSNQSNLTIDAAGGNVDLAGNIAIGSNGRPTPVGDISLTASGTVTMGSSGAPVSAYAHSLSVTADSANIYADPTTSFTYNYTSGATVVGFGILSSTSFNVADASTISGPIAGDTTFTKSGAGKLTLTGANTYTGDTTVNAGVLEIGGTGTLGNGSYAGNINVTGQVRFNNSVGQILSGTMSGTGFINSPGSGVTDITTLADADHYNLIDAYVVPIADGGGSSSVYGDAPAFTYEVATTAAGGTVFTDADPTGTATITGAPTDTSGVGNYTINYGGGITINNERYIVNSGDNLSWAVTAKPLTITVDKVYDGSALFSNGFALSGTVNGDATPTLTGNASAASSNAGTYTSFASSTLSENNSNYTLIGATIDAMIDPHPLDITVSKTYDGSTEFSRGFALSGMVAGDAAPGVSGMASVPNNTAGTYTMFASNNLVLSDANYTLDGGDVSATITPQQPVPPVPTAPPAAPLPPSNPNTAPLTLPDYANPPVSSGGPTTATPITTSNSSVTTPSSTPFDSSVSPSNSSGSSSTAAASSTTPSPASKNDVRGSATTTGEDGIVVALVRDPSVQASGAVSVLVPKDIAVRAGGFSFVLPRQAVKGADVSGLSVSLADGAPLPGWLRFNPRTRTFTATAVPAGGLPLRVIISAKGMKTTIIISETP